MPTAEHRQHRQDIANVAWRVVATIIGVAWAASAAAQSPTPQSSDPAHQELLTWRFGAGYQTSWFRDVARTTFPVDASPASWEGSGLVVSAEHDRTTAKRLHRFSGSFEHSSGFVFRTPVETIARSPDDRAIRVGGQYEYRRYFFRDLGFRGFDVGIGVAGGARYESLARHFEPAIEVKTAGADFTAAGVLAARLTRWRRVQFEVDWANGGAVGQRTTTHASAAEADVSAWGGGWLTDFSVRGDLRVADRASVFGSYFRTGRGRFSTHQSTTSGWGQFLMGIAYGR